MNKLPENSKWRRTYSSNEDWHYQILNGKTCHHVLGRQCVSTINDLCEEIRNRCVVIAEGRWHSATAPTTWYWEIKGNLVFVSGSKSPLHQNAIYDISLGILHGIIIPYSLPNNSRWQRPPCGDIKTVKDGEVFSTILGGKSLMPIQELEEFVGDGTMVQVREESVAATEIAKLKTEVESLKTKLAQINILTNDVQEK